MSTDTPIVNGWEPLLSVGVNVNLDGGKFGEKKGEMEWEVIVLVDKRPSVVMKQA